MICVYITTEPVAQNCAFRLVKANNKTPLLSGFISYCESQRRQDYLITFLCSDHGVLSITMAKTFC